jgi:hypothetical protein
MAFNFQKFTDTKSSFFAKATIRRTGQIGFNAGAINALKITEFVYAILYFDPEQRIVGIELTNTDGPGAIEIKKSETNTFVRARNFCDRFDIDYEESRTYRLLRDPESGFLYFSLNQSEPGDTTFREAVDEAFADQEGMRTHHNT